MAEIERKDVDSYIETMIESEFSYKEIESNLIKKSDLSPSEITAKLQDKFIPLIKKSIKRYLLVAVILGVITIACVIFYYYNKHLQDQFVQSQITSGNATLVGDGKYLVRGNFNNYEFIPSVGGWIGLGAIISLIVSVLSWVKMIKMKNKTIGNDQH
jgi:hypothetical protein